MDLFMGILLRGSLGGRMKRLPLLPLVLTACLQQGQEQQPDPEERASSTEQADSAEQSDSLEQFDPYVISLLIDNQSRYMISAGGAGRMFGNVLPGEEKCVKLPNNDARQQLWFQMQATETKHFTLPFYPRESSGWKWTIRGLGPADHRVGRADAASLIHWSQCSSSAPNP